MTTRLRIDTDGVAGFELDQYLAVGVGSEISLKFTGATFDAAASTLNGRTAISSNAIITQALVAAAPNYSTTNSNLVVFTANPTAAENFVGGSAADVFTDLSAAGGNNYNVNTAGGNDVITMTAGSTGDHQLTGGTGADRLVLAGTGIAAATTPSLLQMAIPLQAVTTK
jgi:hypothetical protein